MKIIEIIAGGFTNWKTTLSAFVAMAFILLHNVFGFASVSQEMQMQIIAVAVFLVGYFSKDADKSGKPLDEN